MTDISSWARWRAFIETASLVAIAVAMVWMVVVRSASPTERPGKSTSAVRRTEAAVPPQPIELTDTQVMGGGAAKVGLVVYSDFQCPFCGKFARETLPILQEQYVKTGRVLVSFRQFPLPNHPFAVKAAEAAECAGRQGQFWPYHDRLFSNPQFLDSASLQEHARHLKLDAARFGNCLNGQASATVQKQKAGGSALQVSGTPAFLVGAMLPDGRLKVLERFSGARPITDFQSRLDRLLALAELAPSSGASQSTSKSSSPR